VLQGLVDGIDDFVSKRQARWRPRVRLRGPALLGSSVWIEDGALIDNTSDLYAACSWLRNRAESRRPRLASRRLTGLAPKVDGKAAIVGPSTPQYQDPIPTIRTLGFRSTGNNDSPPMLLRHIGPSDAYRQNDQKPT
jgi:hypothetical protein